MGKASKKLAKQQSRHKENILQQGNKDLKVVMQEQMEREAYDDALGTIASLLTNKCVDPEVLYNCAVCYFMTGDYTRAGEWINNTLTYAPGHFAARILLARLCILENRVEDGLAIFDFVLDKWDGKISIETQAEIGEILEYYGRNDADKLRQHYPHIAAFMKLDKSEADIARREQPKAVVTNPKPIETKPDVEESDPLAKAQAAIESMQQMMAGITEEEASTATEETVSTFAVEESTDLENILQEIAAKPVSLNEKIKLYNSFAGACYYDNKWEDAAVLLDKALEIDTQQEMSLRNMAYVMLAQGNTGKALEYASRMEVMDFGLLRDIKKQ